MEPKPAGWSERYGAVFANPEVVDHYHLRPPYPAETIDVLAGLARGGAVLDVGCGIGELSRRLASRVERVDAVDASKAMVERGRGQPGGDASNLRWHIGRVEEVVLDGPYTLALAGDSIHWFDWEVALPRLAGVLADDGVLAVVRRDWLREEPLRARLAPVYRRHSANTDFRPLDPVDELERRGLFVRIGEHTAAPESWQPTLAEIVRVHYSSSGCARSEIADPDGFEAEVRETVEQTLEANDGRYDLEVTAAVVWGRPAALTR
ncbi:MAG TPA: class I SAM-dependent methyltransferase [Gaiellaceae bacterium]